MVMFVDQRCVSCGACVVVCPQKAIHMCNGRAVISDDRCTRCQKCVYKCYARAIRAIPDCDINSSTQVSPKGEQP